MMHIITKVVLVAAIPTAMALGIGYLAMRARRPEVAELLYAHAATVAVFALLAGVVVWVGHNVQQALAVTRNLAAETEEAKVRMLMRAANGGNGENADLIFGPKEM